MLILRFAVTLALLALAGCGDDPTFPRPSVPDGRTPAVLGLYEITLSGIGTPAARGSVAPLPDAPGRVLTPRTSGLIFELLSSSTLVDGARGEDGHRYFSFTYRVRNATGEPVRNVTFLPATTPATLPGTPFSALTLFAGGAASASLAPLTVPTGAVTLGGGSAMRATEVDVLQAFTEAEVAAVPLPAGVTGLLPYGFVLRSAVSTATRTLPPAAGPNDFGGLATFAFRTPLAATAAQDPFSITFQVLAVEDTEVRLTESIEEGQDTSAVRRIRERAAELGATTVTVLAGSAAAGPHEAEYPGQRQLCAVRTAGTAAAPVRTITSPAAHTRINLLRPGERVSTCGPRFRDGDPAVAAPGEPYRLTAVAMDRYGNVRAKLTDSVRLERVAGPAAMIAPPAALSGGQAALQVTYGARGSSTLRAVGRRARETFHVEVGESLVEPAAGWWQAGMAGAAVPEPPSVVLHDAAGNPLAGRAVTFSVSRGGGSVTGPVVLTDARGIATVGSWTLGSAGDLNTLTATVSGAGFTDNPVIFQAAGCVGGGRPAFDVTLCYTSPVTNAQRAVFAGAAARWQSLVVGGLDDLHVDQPLGFCGTWVPALDLVVDDLLIFAGIDGMDGGGGILGTAGPCWVRAGDLLPAVGVMRFDAADLELLEAYGDLGPVVLHEMGHVLGIGTLWPHVGLLRNPSSTASRLDTYFAGDRALSAFNRLGGVGYASGQKVPVENLGGVGTVNGHWRESVLVNELMTGYLNIGPNPLSEITVRSLADMGYVVDAAAADPFFRTMTLRNGDGPEPGALPLNDAWTGPLYRADPRGAVTRIR